MLKCEFIFLLDVNVIPGWTEEAKQNIVNQNEDYLRRGAVSYITGFIDVQRLSIINNIDDKAMETLHMSRINIYLYPINHDLIGMILRIVKEKEIDVLSLVRSNLKEEHFDQIIDYPDNV